MLYIAVCDDDADVRSKIANAVKSYGAKKNIKILVRQIAGGEELIQLLAADGSVNLVFLDIFLKTENGIAVAKHVRDILQNQVVQIVYISNIRTLTQEMFECRPMNFLPKPIVDEKIYAEIEKYLEISMSIPKTFSYKISGAVRQKALDEIIYFESMNRRMKIVSINETEDFYSRIKLIYLELKDDGFCFIHRSYIVNVKHITRYARECVIMSNGDKLPVSKSMSKELKLYLISKEMGC